MLFLRLVIVFICVILLSACSKDKISVCEPPTGITDDTRFNGIENTLEQLWCLGLAVDLERERDGLAAFDLVYEIPFGVSSQKHVDLMLDVFVHLSKEHGFSWIYYTQQAHDKMLEVGLINLWNMKRDTAIETTISQNKLTTDRRLEIITRRIYFDYELAEVADGRTALLDDEASVAGPIFARLAEIGLTMEYLPSRGVMRLEDGPGLRFLPLIGATAEMNKEQAQLLLEIVEHIRSELRIWAFDFEAVDGLHVWGIN